MPDLRQQLVRRLEKLGIEHRAWPGRDDGFASFSHAGKEFAHFHGGNELDIRLTRTLIEREGLVHPTDSRVHPKRSKSSPWIELRFSKAADLERIVALVKLAVALL